MRDLSYNIIKEFEEIMVTSYEIDYSYIHINDIKGNNLIVKKIE